MGFQAFAQRSLLQTPIGDARPGKPNKTDNHRMCLRIPSHPAAGVRTPDELTRYIPCLAYVPR